MRNEQPVAPVRHGVGSAGSRGGEAASRGVATTAWASRRQPPGRLAEAPRAFR